MKRKTEPPRAEVNALVALYNERRYGEAESQTRALLGHYPDFGFGWKLLGGTLQKQGKEALSAFQKVAEFMPDDADGHFNLGVALKSLGRLDQAVASYRRAVALKPDFALAYYNLGNAQKELGQRDIAAISYRRATEIKPDFVEAHYNLGAVLKDLGQLDAALESYRRLLQIKPDFAEAHNTLAIILRELGQFNDAIASHRRALEIKPDYAEAHSNLGNALKDLGQLDAALASYRRALEIKPDYAGAHTNLGNALQAIGNHDEAMASYRLALEFKPDDSVMFSNLLFALNHTTHTPAYCLEEARKYGRMVGKKVKSRFSDWQSVDHPERLRVGLVSGDLRKHPVGYFMEGLLAHINPARIELVAYPTQSREDELTAHVRPYFSTWKPLYGLSDEAAARLIHADGVNVLLDLSGHTEHNRLPVFAWKPAPVQVSWLGLPATTGVTEMDYVLGDPYAIPTEYENHFSEAVWRMPESCLCLALPSSAMNVAPLPALSMGYVTFGSFNNLTKMNDSVVAVWARLLKSVPDSRLLLKTKPLNDIVVCEKIRQRFASCGIDPDRLLLCGVLASRDDHLAMYNKIDIALDTFPYPGVTTSVEALWMGVPVLSMRGDRFLSSTAGSIAHNAGLPDWIATDEDEYVAKAVEQAANMERLATLRAGLRQQVLVSPLFDSKRFARNFEDALWGMWQARVQNNAPTSSKVSDRLA